MCGRVLSWRRIGPFLLHKAAGIAVLVHLINEKYAHLVRDQVNIVHETKFCSPIRSTFEGLV